MHSLPYLSRVCFRSNFVNILKHKHLMTGFKGKSEFSFPRLSNVPELRPKGKIRVK